MSSILAPPMAPSLQDAQLLATLRPQSLGEFIGQDALRQNLEISVLAARMRGKPLTHTLFYGGPGLGKTSLAQIVAKEMCAPLISITGPSLKVGADLITILTRMTAGTILFIDEAHSISREIEELLYVPMEDGRLDVVLDSGSSTAKIISMPLVPFTIIGATTRKGTLSAPLLARFGLDFALDFYDQDAMQRIVKRSALLSGLDMPDDAVAVLAHCCRGVPRIANRLLKRVDDYALVCGTRQITAELVSDTLYMLGIDSSGMDKMDRRYLSVLRDTGRAMGLGALSAAMQEDVNTLSDVIEPFLTQLALIGRTPSGRVLTDKGKQWAAKY